MPPEMVCIPWSTIRAENGTPQMVYVIFRMSDTADALETLFPCARCLGFATRLCKSYVNIALKPWCLLLVLASWPTFALNGHTRFTHFTCQNSEPTLQTTVPGTLSYHPL